MRFELNYFGGVSDEHRLDFYDASQAMLGFQRSLALTTHLILNGTIITQAPSLKGANIYLLPTEAGSYKIPAYVTSFAIAAYGLGTAPQDTPLGHLMYSAYDFAIQRTLGIEVDYNQSLGAAYERAQREHGKDFPFPVLDEHRFDSLAEKLEPAALEMHRPIVRSETALEGRVGSFSGLGDENQTPINRATYEFLISSTFDDRPIKVIGRVSSYNINTFKGRVFVEREKRPIPFELGDVARSSRIISRITSSLRLNARNRNSDEGDVELTVYPRRKRNGKLKSFLVVDVG